VRRRVECSRRGETRVERGAREGGKQRGPSLPLPSKKKNLWDMADSFESE